MRSACTSTLATARRRVNCSCLLRAARTSSNREGRLRDRLAIRGLYLPASCQDSSRTGSDTWTHEPILTPLARVPRRPSLRDATASSNARRHDMTLSDAAGRKGRLEFRERTSKRLSCARVEAPVLSVGEAPGLCRGLLLIRLDPAYRLTWTLVPPAPGPLMRAPSPLETTLTQRESLPL